MGLASAVSDTRPVPFPARNSGLPRGPDRDFPSPRSGEIPGLWSERRPQKGENPESAAESAAFCPGILQSRVSARRRLGRYCDQGGWRSRFAPAASAGQNQRSRHVLPVHRGAATRILVGSSDLPCMLFRLDLDPPNAAQVPHERSRRAHKAGRSGWRPRRELQGTSPTADVPA